MAELLAISFLFIGAFALTYLRHVVNQERAKIKMQEKELKALKMKKNAADTSASD